MENGTKLNVHKSVIMLRFIAILWVYEDSYPPGLGWEDPHAKKVISSP